MKWLVVTQRTDEVEAETPQEAAEKVRAMIAVSPVQGEWPYLRWDIFSCPLQMGITADHWPLGKPIAAGAPATVDDSGRDGPDG